MMTEEEQTGQIDDIIQRRVQRGARLQASWECCGVLMITFCIAGAVIWWLGQVLDCANAKCARGHGELMSLSGHLVDQCVCVESPQ